MLSGGAEVDERRDADDDDGNNSDRIHGSAPLSTLIYHKNMEKKDRKPGTGNFPAPALPVKDYLRVVT